MSTARDIFLARLTNFENALSSNDLMSRALTDRVHNEKARMLRNGLAIVGYTILEDFIKKRIGEILKEIGRCGVSFNALPTRLKESAVVSALKGIQVRADNLKRVLEDHITFIQEETGNISSTKDAVFELSEYTFGWDKSNISSDDISSFLTNFNVNGGWDSIRQISTIINIALPNPTETFRNAAQRRHRAAHNADADSLLTDLQGYVSQAKVIALGLDLLLSKSLKHIKDNNQNFLNSIMKTECNQIKFRFLVEVGSDWKEYKSNFTRTFRVNNSYDILFNAAIQRARNGSEVLIIKSSNNQILNWYITEL